MKDNKFNFLTLLKIKLCSRKTKKRIAKLEKSLNVETLEPIKQKNIIPKKKSISFKGIGKNIATLLEMGVMAGLVLLLVGFLLFALAFFAMMMIDMFTFIWNESSIWVKIPIGIMAIACVLIVIAGISWLICDVAIGIKKYLEKRDYSEWFKENKTCDTSDYDDVDLEWLKNRDKAMKTSLFGIKARHVEWEGRFDENMRKVTGR